MPFCMTILAFALGKEIGAQGEEEAEKRDENSTAKTERASTFNVIHVNGHGIGLIHRGKTRGWLGSDKSGRPGLISRDVDQPEMTRVVPKGVHSTKT